MSEQPNEISMSSNAAVLTLGDAQALVDAWIKTVGVRYFSELTNTAVLMEEVGELARLMSRSYGDQSFKAGEKQGSEALGEEMADVLFVLICLANQTGVDLTKAFQKSMEKKTKRDADRHKNNPKLG
ncbi:MAG: nucleotide pyrophosphohydrolase [Bacteroidetes bacterium]|jgi:NTP pyrophosphatase (non-canonical NTP hydrolase)|nr:nucleotide pyrophosphohydrolase [Bacteroidota bacterium]